MTKAALLYDGDCRLCRRSAAIIADLDWRSAVDRLPLQEAGRLRDRFRAEDLRRELHLVMPDGQVHRGFFAFRRLAWMIPLLVPLAPFLYLPGAALLGPRVYRFIADHRR